MSGIFRRLGEKAGLLLTTEQSEKATLLKNTKIQNDKENKRREILNKFMLFVRNPKEKEHESLIYCIDQKRFCLEKHEIFGDGKFYKRPEMKTKTNKQEVVELVDYLVDNIIQLPKPEFEDKKWTTYNDNEKELYNNFRVGIDRLEGKDSVVDQYGLNPYYLKFIYDNVKKIIENRNVLVEQIIDPTAQGETDVVDQDQSINQNQEINADEKTEHLWPDELKRKLLVIFKGIKINGKYYVYSEYLVIKSLKYQTNNTTCVLKEQSDSGCELPKWFFNNTKTLSELYKTTISGGKQISRTNKTGKQKKKKNRRTPRRRTRRRSIPL